MGIEVQELGSDKAYVGILFPEQPPGGSGGERAVSAGSCRGWRRFAVPSRSPVPAEVAAPSKRGPSAFILAPLIETELSFPLEGGVYFASFSSG